MNQRIHAILATLALALSSIALVLVAHFAAFGHLPGVQAPPPRFDSTAATSPLGQVHKGTADIGEAFEGWYVDPDGGVMGTYCLPAVQGSASGNARANEHIDETVLVRFDVLDASACGDTGNCDARVYRGIGWTNRGGVLVNPDNTTTDFATGPALGIGLPANVFADASANIINDGGNPCIQVFPNGVPATITVSGSYNRIPQYVTPPAVAQVLSVSPNVLATSYLVGIPLTITTTTGAATGVSAVTIGTTVLTGCSGAGSTINCTLPAGSNPAGATNVYVTSPAGPLPCSGCMTFVNSLLSSITPTSGPTSGGTPVQIFANAGMTGACIIPPTLDGVTCTACSVISDQQVNCTSAAGSAGTGPVVVSSGSSPNSGSVTYMYNAAPVVSTFTCASSGSGTIPSSTSAYGYATDSIGSSITCTATGTNFATGAGATTFLVGPGGGVACGSSNCSTTSNCTCTLGLTRASANIGLGPVQATTGAGSGSLSNAFTYLDWLVTVFGGSTCVFFEDEARIQPFSGSAVSAPFADQSGNGNNVATVTSLAYVASDSTINNTPSWTLNGTSSCANSGSSQIFPNQTTALSFYTAVKNTSASATHIIHTQGSSWGNWLGTVGPPQFSGPSSGSVAQWGSTAINTWGSWWGYWSGPSSSTVLEIQIAHGNCPAGSGPCTQTNGATASTSGPSPVAIGCADVGGSLSQFMPGSMAAVVISTCTVTGTQLTNASSHLNARFGIN